jgi:hypothetical protein
MTCEFCGKAAEMDFNAFLPSFGIMVRGNVCMACWSQSDDDLAVAAALFKKRAEVRGIPLPVRNWATLAQLAEPIAKEPA